MRSLAEYVSSDPALLNPLAYFFPEPVDPDFSWNYFLQVPDKYFFLPNVDAVDPTNQMTGGWLEEWPNAVDAQSAMFIDTYGADNVIDISGDVDFFGYVWGCGVGEEGGDSQFYIMPRKISWDLFSWDAVLETGGVNPAYHPNNIVTREVLST